MPEEKKEVYALLINGKEYGISDAEARSKIPQRTSQLSNDSNYVSLTENEYRSLCALLETN